MALSARLDTYLVLERQMMSLDEAKDPLAETLRDAMDHIWYVLTDEEHQFLDSRSDVDLATQYPCVLKATPAFLFEPSRFPDDPPREYREREIGLEVPLAESAV